MARRLNDYEQYYSDMYDRDPDKYFNEFRDPDLNGREDDGGGYGGGSGGGFSYRKALQAAREAAEAMLRAQTEAAVARLGAQRPEIEKQYQNSAQQAYLNKMLSQRDLPQQLQASGLSGGMADSMRLALDTNYGNSLNKLGEGKNSALNSLDSDIASVRASGDAQIAQNAMQYAQMLAQQALEEQRAQRELQSKLELLEFQVGLGVAGDSGGSGRKSGASGAYKPKLTFQQVSRLLDAGSDSDELRRAYRYYVGSDYAAGRKKPAVPGGSYLNGSDWNQAYYDQLGSYDKNRYVWGG